METTEGVEPSQIIVEEILPPRIEDAGLEDCALPLDSIHEAFLKAATGVGSRWSSSFTSDEEDDDAGPGVPQEPSDRIDGPAPATWHACDAVVIDGECAAEDGDSSETTTRKDGNEDEEACAVGLQQLEI